MYNKIQLYIVLQTFCYSIRAEVMFRMFLIPFFNGLKRQLINIV